MLTPKQLVVLMDRGVALGPAEEEELRGSPAVRCLFGAVDPLDAARFAEEHLRADRDRFLRRFGFDILAPGLLRDEEEEEGEEEGGGRQPAPVRDEDPRAPRRDQLRNYPYTRQLLITNLWRARRRPTSLQVLKTLRRRASEDSADTASSTATMTPPPTTAAAATWPAPATTF